MGEESAALAVWFVLIVLIHIALQAYDRTSGKREAWQLMHSVLFHGFELFF